MTDNTTTAGRRVDRRMEDLDKRIGLALAPLWPTEVDEAARTRLLMGCSAVRKIAIDNGIQPGTIEFGILVGLLFSQGSSPVHGCANHNSPSAAANHLRGFEVGQAIMSQQRTFDAEVALLVEEHRRLSAREEALAEQFRKAFGLDDFDACSAERDRLDGGPTEIDMTPIDDTDTGLDPNAYEADDDAAD